MAEKTATLIKQMMMEREARLHSGLSGKAKQLFDYLVQTAMTEGGASRATPGAPRVNIAGLRHAGFASPYGYVFAPPDMPESAKIPPDEILESREAKLVHGLSEKDWWELGKDIVRD